MHSRETPPNTLEAALRVAALGLRIHPLSGKRAILEDWPAQATCGSQAHRRSGLTGNGRSYGIVCDEVAVIDTDTPELAAWWDREHAADPLAACILPTAARTFTIVRFPTCETP